MTVQGSIDDASFGPQLGHEFDFTVVFNNTILTASTASLMIAAAPIYMLWYRKTTAVTSKRTLLWAKMIAAIPLIALEIARSAVWTNSEDASSSLLISTTITAKVLSTVSAGSLAVTLCYDHLYSLQSTASVSLILTVSVLTEATRTRSFFLRNSPGMTTVAGLSLGCVILKTLLVVLLELPKSLDSAEYRDRDLVSDATVGFWNRNFMVWVTPLFLKGYRRKITIGDLNDLAPDTEAQHLADQIEQIWAAADKTDSYALAKACGSVLRWHLFTAWVANSLFDIFCFVNVFVIQATLEYMQSTDDNLQIAGGLIGANVLLYFLTMVVSSSSTERNNQLAVRVRGLLTSMMIEKTMHLPTETAKESAALTLINADITGITDTLPDMFSLTLIAPELAVAFYCLWTVIGGAFFLTVVPLILSVVFGYFSGAKMSAATTAWNKAIQERVAKTSDVLSQIKPIKMIGLEPVMTRFLNNLREIEIEKSIHVRKLRLIFLASLPLNYWFTPGAAFIGAVYWTVWKDGVDPVGIWVALNFIDLVRTPMWFLLRSWTIAGEFFACINRIQAFLVLEERKEFRQLRRSDRASDDVAEKETSLSKEAATVSISVASAGNCISMENITVPSKNADKNVLGGISLSIPAGKITMVVGRVGAGKSVFLKMLLGEITPSSGEMEVSSFRMANCDQNTWLPDDTLQDVITMHTAFDEDRFNSVIKACDLERDLETIGGRQAQVGSNGSKLSGGQKQRIALARAVYSSCPIIVADDILSALDKRTAANIFEAVFSANGILKKEGRTTIMATHARRWFYSADQIISLSTDGSAAVHEGTAAVRTFAETEGAEVSSSYYAATEPEDLSNKAANFQQSLAYAREDEKHATYKLETALYRYLFRSIPLVLILLSILGTSLYAFGERCPELYIRLWVEFQPKNKNMAWAMIAVGSLAMVIAAIQAWLFLLEIVPKISRQTHATFTSAVLLATLPFLTATSNGTLLNRFSQDVTILGQELPMAFNNTVHMLALYVSNLAFVVAGTNYTALTIPVILLILWLLQKFYLRTSQQMRILDLEAKTPLLTLVNDSGRGVEHIRSFGMQGNVIRRTFDKLDYSQRPYFIMISIQRWLLLVLDIIGVFIAAVLVSVALLSKKSSSQASLGLALYNMAYFSRLSRTMIQRWTTLETSLGAAMRLRDFEENTPSEKAKPDGPTRREPPAAWPSAGRVEFKGVSAKYGSDAAVPLALNDITTTIEPKQKVVITGRTGSGKSTAVLSLLNLVNITAGQIIIDGIDITTIEPKQLRKRITSLPQESISIADSVWNNLLPFDVLNDNHGGKTVAEDAVVDKLKEIGIWEHIEARGGLQAPMADMHFSSGHKQILNVVRAMVHHEQFETKIVLMDEVTSNLDFVSNETVQQMMERAFRGTTWIIISHDTRAALDCDKVLTFGSGRLIKAKLVDVNDEEIAKASNDTVRSDSTSDSEAEKQLGDTAQSETDVNASDSNL